jgi:hypothetical protein
MERHTQYVNAVPFGALTQKATKKVEDHAKGVKPFNIIDVDVINGFKFDYEPLLLYLLKLFQLEDAARDINQLLVQFRSLWMGLIYLAM